MRLLPNALPLLPLEEERLNDMPLRESFIERAPPSGTCLKSQTRL
jgi:hypothetical protein